MAAPGACALSTQARRIASERSLLAICILRPLAAGLLIAILCAGSGYARHVHPGQ
jgi:hypothetical protein